MSFNNTVKTRVAESTVAESTVAESTVAESKVHKFFPKLKLIFPPQFLQMTY